MWAGMDDGLGLRVGGGQIAWPTLLGTDERRHDFELDLKKRVQQQVLSGRERRAQSALLFPSVSRPGRDV